MFSLTKHRIREGLLIVLILSAFVASASPGRIVYPGRACPVIVQSGQTFEILYQNQRDAPIDSVLLKGPYHSVGIQISDVMTGYFEFDMYTGAAVNNKIRVTIPTSAPADLCDLLVYAGEEIYRSVKSVKVVREFSAQHRFIHISDPHVSRQWVGTPENGYAKELELLDKFVEVANIIAPDFVMVTGDLIHDYTRFNADSVGWGGITVTEKEKRPGVEEKYRNYFEGSHGFSGVQAIETPVFSSTGNHDFYGLPAASHKDKALQWNELCGKRVYGFAYAGTRVLVADDCLSDPETEYPSGKLTTGPQGKILKDFLRNNGEGSLRILALHKPAAIDTAFCDENRIAAVIHGHVHTPDEQRFGKTPTLKIRSGSVSRSGSVTEWEKVLGFFRLFSIDGDRMQMSPALRFCNNPTASYEDLDINLTASYTGMNDGTLSANEVTIHNRFPIDLKQCRIRFVMKKGHTYQVSGGKIEQVIEGDKVTVVDVRFDVQKGAESRVICRSPQ